MESVKDLNMDADEMLVVLSALDKVNRRIKEVAQTLLNLLRNILQMLTLP